MTVARVLNELKARLKAENIESYRLDSELIVMRATGLERIQLITRDNTELDENQLKSVEEMAERRLKKEPMQYILGSCEFMGMPFKVTADTLIPRGDTECLVERVIDYVKEKGYNSILDIGTGSGAIAVSLSALTCCRVTAVDISPYALAVAKENAELNNAEVDFVLSDLFENIEDSFDVIVSNPPYIESDVILELDSCVKDYEPLTALDGGRDGLDFYRAITAKSLDYLNPNGLLAFEIGYNQGEAVKVIMEQAGFKNVKVEKDLAGLDRTVCGVLTP